MSSFTVRSNFERFLSSDTNKLCSKVNYGCGMLDDGFFKLGQYGVLLGAQVAEIRGDYEEQQRCQKISDNLGTARTAIGASRLVLLIPKLITGQIFWQTNAEGWRRVKCNRKGEIVRIAPEDLNIIWKKNDKGVWERRYGRVHLETSTDGKYIEDPVRGVYVTRDSLDILTDVGVLAARVIAFVRFFFKDHQGLKGATMVLWSAIVSISLIQTIRDLGDERDPKSVQKKCWDLVQSGVDLFALPGDFGFGASNRVLAIIWTIANILSALLLIIREAVINS